MVLGRLFGGRSKGPVLFEAPQGTRIYAVGDIHGRIDLLRILHREISEDIADDPAARHVVVYLGDYVDRGYESRAVIDFLLDSPLPVDDTVYLTGNHEDIMLRFLEDESLGPSWFMNGGDATLLSYGVQRPGTVNSAERLRQLRESLGDEMPERHLAFYRRLRLMHIEGDYLFVHAGIRPGRPLESQNREDLLWIRDEFLKSTADHGYCVVHGHSISEKIDLQPNRIGIDTGAFYSDRLTCLVLEGTARRMIQT